MQESKIEQIIPLARGYRQRSFKPRTEKLSQSRTVPLLPHNVTACYRCSGYRYIQFHVDPSISAATNAHLRQGNGFYMSIHINID